MPFVVGVIVKNYLFEGMVSIDCNSWMRKNCPKKKFWVDRRDFLVIIDKKNGQNDNFIFARSTG